MPEVATRYVPQHFTPLFNRDIDVSFRVMHGGRGGGKSKTAALGIVHFIEWYEATTGKPCRVLCARETQKSITHSSKDAIESVIDELGRGAYYKILSNQIRTPRGGYILFHGISEQYRTDRSVKSLENINLVWFEEGEYMSARSRELLYPTVFRNPGSEIWVTFNPHFRTDPVYMDFIAPGRRRERALIMHGNFLDMPLAWRTAEQEAERQDTLRYEPDRYKHIWEGVTDDEGEAFQLLTYADIDRCIEAWDKGQVARRGYVYGGFDVADGGENNSALTVKQGPCVIDAVQWSKRANQSVNDVIRLAQEYKIDQIYYDASGVGSVVSALFLERSNILTFKRRGINFGGEVEGKDRMFMQNRTNGEFFANQGTQMAWNLRMRAKNTERLLEGESVDPRVCLFINPDMNLMGEYMTQLTRPRWVEDSRARVRVDKDPEDEGSPDMYDATALTFAYDIRDGLRMTRAA